MVVRSHTKSLLHQASEGRKNVLGWITNQFAQSDKKCGANGGMTNIYLFTLNILKSLIICLIV